MSLRKIPHASLAGGPLMLRKGWPHEAAKNAFRWPHEAAKWQSASAILHDFYIFIRTRTNRTFTQSGALVFSELAAPRLGGQIRVG